MILVSGAMPALRLDNPAMFLRAGALSLLLLVASRLLGLARETAQAAALGASGLGDVAILMLTLPDWVAGMLASGALAYAMLPAWAGRAPAEVAASQRRLAWMLVGAGLLLGSGLVVWRHSVAQVLAPGLSPALVPAAAEAMGWVAPGLPLALLAALWVARLQHEREFLGMYGANLVVNGILVITLALMAVGAGASEGRAVAILGLGLVVALVLRLLWLRLRLQPYNAPVLPTSDASLPGSMLWGWAALAAALPLALPFAARSLASAGGEGALATFNYAWKLVELPLLLAIQLVASLAFPSIARAFAGTQGDAAARAAAVRPAFALAWTLACAAAAALLLAAPALAQLLFGWGRMDAQAVGRVASWGRVGAWGLLPQALIAVALTVLAARRRMHLAVLAYAGGFAILLGAGFWGLREGAALMIVLNGVLVGVSLVALTAMGRQATDWLPWRALGAGTGAVAASGLLSSSVTAWPAVAQLAAAAAAAAATVGIAWQCSSDVRASLQR